MLVVNKDLKYSSQVEHVHCAPVYLRPACLQYATILLRVVASRTSSDMYAMTSRLTSASRKRFFK